MTFFDQSRGLLKSEERSGIPILDAQSTLGMPSAPAPCRIALVIAGCAILAAPQQSLGALLPIFSSQGGVLMKGTGPRLERGDSTGHSYVKGGAVLRCRGGNEDDPVRPGEFVIGEKGEEDDGEEEDFEGREYEEIKVMPARTSIANSRPLAYYSSFVGRLPAPPWPRVPLRVPASMPRFRAPQNKRSLAWTLICTGKRSAPIPPFQIGVFELPRRKRRVVGADAFNPAFPNRGNLLITRPA